MAADDALGFAHAPTRAWFEAAFEGPTRAQSEGWAAIAEGKSSLILAPTGSGKTLAAFLAAIDKLMFSPEPEPEKRLRVLYISPLKALGVDVDRNLRAPLRGIAALAQRMGVDHRLPEVAIRSGDTPQRERERQRRHPPDILITTPESLYLLLTSRAREGLRSVDVVIVDEVHAIAGTKRGAHLWVSLERLEGLRPEGAPPLQRIGLSATQRPLERIARALGGGQLDDEGRIVERPVSIVDAGRKRPFELRVEVPVEDMAKLGETAVDPDDPFPDVPSGPASVGGAGSTSILAPSIWPSIHPRLVELIQAHRSTMIFVNSRRLAERLAAAINELADEDIAAAHHGSLAREQREVVEDRLKRGKLPAIVATSSMELGIDMGAIDLVIQIEAPPSVAAGVQRIGRAGHHVGGTPRGVIFPKYRGDLLACAAATAHMHAGEVESTTVPRNPLDVLAQQIVAMVAVEDREVDELYEQLRRAAPFWELPRSSFEGVLDLLSGRYPSDEFAPLRPRVTWDRIVGRLTARRGAQRIAVANPGTIPDRGLYGVFLHTGAEDGPSSKRVGELDEEMVFESSVGDVFVLGASSWRITEITHDRVLVIPAPGEPGRMPFWHGDSPGRPLEFGQAIGALTRELQSASSEAAHARLVEDHGLDAGAATNLLTYLADQAEATGRVPSDRSIVVERVTDEAGDWRVLILTPFGARVHAPWATAVAGRLRHELGMEVDLMWSDDGIVFRLPETEHAPEIEPFFPGSDEVEDLLVAELGNTAMFAARFRENAGRALLLPRRRPGRRSPLWIQRKKAADLLAVASRFRDFPVILETYRECLQDVFDLPGLQSILRGIESRAIELVVADTERPSPFAGAILFNYVANFLYDGDAPLAERRAQALALDHAQLKALMGEAELRELLDAKVIAEVAASVALLGEDRQFFDEDGLHDRLLSLGDLREDELRERCRHPEALEGWLEEMVRTRRICRVGIGGEMRFIAAEDAGRYRDALGTATAPGLPSVFLDPVEDALGDLVHRFARTHGPFVAEEVAARFGIGVAPVRSALSRLAERGRLHAGAFLPGGSGREWCAGDVLRRIKRRSLAKLRDEIEAVDGPSLARFGLRWHQIDNPGVGLDAVLDAVERLQGCPLSLRSLDTSILPARVADYRSADLDELCAAGELVWRGIAPGHGGDAKIALFLVDQAPALAPLATPVEGELAEKIRALLAERGACFFPELEAALGGFAGELEATLWSMVWAGEVTNDTLAPLRSRLRAGERKRGVRGRRSFRSRRQARPGTEGRWSLFLAGVERPNATRRATAACHNLLERHGVLTREAVAAEGLQGGFAGIYPVLRAMEDAGRVRRGYFVAGLTAAQFAVPGADDLLRSRPLDDRPREPSVALLAATDPANPYGAALAWPRDEDPAPAPDQALRRLQRAVGAHVVLVEGELVAYLDRSDRHLRLFLPDDEVARRQALAAAGQALRARALPGQPLFLESIDGEPAAKHPHAEALTEAGYELSGTALRAFATLDETLMDGAAASGRVRTHARR